MRSTTSVFWIFLIAFSLPGCSGGHAVSPPLTAIPPLATVTIQNQTLKPSLPPQTATIVPPETTPADLAAFHLSEPGPYWTAYKRYTFIDQSRSDRTIKATIWYPALKTYAADGSPIFPGPPDLAGAPYPVIMTGNNSGNFLYKSHLASQGFVMIIVTSPGFSYTEPWNNSVIDAPLDFLFVLDEVTSKFPADLEGVLDTDRVGVAGYSSDGLFSLALGGARINPEYYFSQCAQAPTLSPPLSPFWTEYFCRLSQEWGEFSSQVGVEISTNSEGLWQPTTDDRILAVMPMAPDSAWLYGPEGLAAIKVPSLIIAGTADQMVSYKKTSCYVHEHLVNSEEGLISFIGKNHMMVENQEVIDRINHFTVAFFGYYLQGRTELADYFSEAYVSQFDDLYWGSYPAD